MASSSSTSKKVYYCEHCKQELSKTLFFSHKKLYYNTRLRKWQKQRVKVVERDFTLFESGGGGECSDEFIFSDHSSDPEGIFSY